MGPVEIAAVRETLKMKLALSTWIEECEYKHQNRISQNIEQIKADTEVRKKKIAERLHARCASPDETTQEPSERPEGEPTNNAVQNLDGPKPDKSERASPRQHRSDLPTRQDHYNRWLQDHTNLREFV